MVHSARLEMTGVDALHHRIHSLASELVELHRSGNKTDAAAGLGNLYALRDHLLEALDRMWNRTA